jgi:hypothetical protein
MIAPMNRPGTAIHSLRTTIVVLVLLGAGTGCKYYNPFRFPPKLPFKLQDPGPAPRSEISAPPTKPAFDPPAIPSRTAIG